MEIFQFYVRLHKTDLRDFQLKMEKNSIMEIGEFMLFCRDFKLPLKKQHLLELFKKSSENRKNVVNFN